MSVKSSDRHCHAGILTRRHFDEGRGTTGKILEAEVVGTCKCGYGRIERTESYYRAMYLARESQPDTLCPIGKSFRALVAKMLEVPEHYVQLFTSVDSCLDRHFGVDGWFEYKGIVVTFDLTRNRQKEKSREVDIVVFMRHAEDNLMPYAIAIAEIFFRRLEQERKGVCGQLSDKVSANIRARARIKENEFVPEHLRRYDSKPAPCVDLFWRNSCQHNHTGACATA